jgi:hypothetical protein
MGYTEIPLKVLTPAFLTSLANFVKEEKKIDGEVVVTGLEEESYETGGCESCAYTDYNMCVSFTTDGERGGYYTFNGRFEYLVNRLVDL